MPWATKAADSQPPRLDVARLVGNSSLAAEGARCVWQGLCVFVIVAARSHHLGAGHEPDLAGADLRRCVRRH